MAANSGSARVHPFAADRPIASRAEDLLGRASFADSLASVIRGWRDKESLVIGLYGEWGSGKSSIKNMILESLRSVEAGSPLIVEFNPWQWSGQDQLAEAFFQEVGLLLGRSDKTEDEKRRAANWRTYGAYLTVGASLTKSLKTILPLLGLPGSGIADLLTKTLAQSEAVVQDGSGGLEGQGAAYQRTLAEIKRELYDSLKALEKPILVVLDDIDRLTPEEIRLLFQLIKANADFPNLIYLLLFQREIVEHSLGSPPSINGHEFLEKIVQVGFNIPPIERTRLERVLTTGLDELLADERVGAHFDRKRWGNLFLGGLRPYFQTLRDVYRYLATLSFHVTMFRSKHSFEVNPVDIIAVEVLRVFEPDVYQRLFDAKAELTSLRSHASEWDGQNERTKILIESIVAAGSQHDQVREIIKQLFPPVEWVFGGHRYEYDFRGDWFRQVRLCHPDVFDRYFLLTIPEGDISTAELDRLLALVGDRNGLVGEFRALNERGLLGIALDRLEAYKETIDVNCTVPFVTALFDIGDELPEEAGGFFAVSPDLHAVRIIHWSLKQEKDPGKRGQILKEAMEATPGLLLPIMTVSSEGNAVERKQNPDTFNVTEGDLAELRQICVRKIEQVAGSGLLTSHSKTLAILNTWRDWDSPGRPREWVNSLAKSPQGALSFLVACLQRSISRGVGDYVPQEHWIVNLRTIEDFVALDVLERQLNSLSMDSLHAREIKAVQAFRKALRWRREGKPDHYWLHDDDE